MLGLLLLPDRVVAQTHLQGFVLEEDDKGRLKPLQAANVYWLGSTSGTTSDMKGFFSLPLLTGSTKLVISYIGYKNDTIIISRQKEVKVILKNARNLSVVEISGDRASTFISSINPIKTQVMTEQELFKAACCNLSESFETNPAVDVSYTDAVTGVKQIQMLGLSGSYIQLQRENMPDVRGLSGYYGLNFTPGSWIESIQLTKGVGSIVNGYESISGQLNVELKKPDTGDYVFANGYLNQMGRSEANWYSRHRLNSKWSTAFLLHGNLTTMKNDVNKDGFLDIPTGSQWNIINRWKYDNGQGIIGQFNVQALKDDRVGGQTAFDPAGERNSTTAYGTGMQLERYSADGKLGYLFPMARYRSIGLQLKLVDQRSSGYFGLNNYAGRQQTIYANLIYQDILGTTDWKYRTGLSWMYDDYDEIYKSVNYQREEQVPGAFYELSYMRSRWSVVSGLRYDLHNLYGGFFTPRIHAKYDITENTAVRASAGRGYRVANVFMENLGGLVSSRLISIQSVNNVGYGLSPEIAWNYGLNFTHAFRFARRDGQLSLDYYHTRFENQVVADYDFSPQQLLLYNLNGRSFSNSFQAELNYQPMRRMDLRLAYRLLDVRTDYATGFLSKPLIAPHRLFANVGYKTRSDWSFDYTVQWFTTKRLPTTASNPEAFRFPDQSPAFVLMNAQISKKLGSWDVYLGLENVGDFRQQQLVNASTDPYSPYFDASLVWGPAIERMIYLGFRWRISPPAPTL